MAKNREGIICALAALLLAWGCEQEASGPAVDDYDSDYDAGSTDTDTDVDADADSDSDGDSDTGSEECASVNETAENVLLPVDIIIAVDNSNSMEWEANWVQDNLNDFSWQISSSGVDHHIVLISDVSPGDEAGICVAPPLGAGSCPDDSNPPLYKHVPVSIGSNDALEKIAQSYDQWSDMLRPGSFRHVVVISDDDSDWGAWEFINSMASYPNPIGDFTFHAICSSLGWEDLTCIFQPLSPCCVIFAPARGQVYEDLVGITGGVLGDLCLQDFQPVFDEMAVVMSDSTLTCEWEIPDPPEGEVFDPAMVNMDFVDEDAVTHAIGHVETVADCDLVEHGWYYDDNDTPSMVHVCPQTCEWIQGQENAEIVIKFGCDTIPAIPE
jgi:hypothetical protein